MIEIGEAQHRVLEDIPLLGRERIHILDALGRVLAQDVKAVRDVPYRDNSAMDGYACRHRDLAGAESVRPVTLKLVGESRAGSPFEGFVGLGEAVSIMTGAVIPRGADAVIKVEDTVPDGSAAVKCLTAPRPGQYIRAQGEDVRAGETVLETGTPIRPSEIGMLATLGHGYVHVYQRPIVAILSTGDELTDLDQPFSDGKVICSNGYSLAAQVMEAGAVPLSLGIASDSEEDQRSRLLDGLRADVILTSGGVSVGKYDFVKSTLSEVGMKVKFWKVAMKPGKPLVFGTIGTKPVFGLPGNPTSAMISFEQFVRPALLKMMGRRALFRRVIEAVLAKDVVSEAGRLHLVRCRLIEENGHVWAVSTGTQSSGALRSMVLADGLMILPPSRRVYAKGTRVKVQILHSNSPLAHASPFWSRDTARDESMLSQTA
ncbi:MAG: molybdopterin molybdotransferase MoeA [Desulfomonilaceae bacterium]|nr:molybdopterin molybdotransferase MoeA [Desulfomonilaceae bacterium]